MPGDLPAYICAEGVVDNLDVLERTGLVDKESVYICGIDGNRLYSIKSTQNGGSGDRVIFKEDPVGYERLTFKSPVTLEEVTLRGFFYTLDSALRFMDNFKLTWELYQDQVTSDNSAAKRSFQDALTKLHQKLIQLQSDIRYAGGNGTRLYQPKFRAIMSEAFNLYKRAGLDEQAQIEIMFVQRGIFQSPKDVESYIRDYNEGKPLPSVFPSSEEAELVHAAALLHQAEAAAAAEQARLAAQVPMNVVENAGTTLGSMGPALGIMRPALGSMGPALGSVGPAPPALGFKDPYANLRQYSRKKISNGSGKKKAWYHHDDLCTWDFTTLAAYLTEDIRRGLNPMNRVERCIAARRQDLEERRPIREDDERTHLAALGKLEGLRYDLLRMGPEYVSHVLFIENYPGIQGGQFVIGSVSSRRGGKRKTRRSKKSKKQTRRR